MVDALQRIVEANEERQKLIKTADRSELGWRVVQHYVADPIADKLSAVLLKTRREPRS